MLKDLIGEYSHRQKHDVELINSIRCTGMSTVQPLRANLSQAMVSYTSAVMKDIGENHPLQDEGHKIQLTPNA